MRSAGPGGRRRDTLGHAPEEGRLLPAEDTKRVPAPIGAGLEEPFAGMWWDGQLAAAAASTGPSGHGR